MTDVRGKEIKVGSTVAYPDRRGAHLWLNVAKVIAVTTRSAFEWVDATIGYDYVSKPVLKVKRADGTISRVQRIDRVVVVR